MSHRQKEIVPDGGKIVPDGNEFFCVCLEYEICDYQQRSRECMMGCTFQGQKDRGEQCS